MYTYRYPQCEPWEPRLDFGQWLNMKENIPYNPVDDVDKSGGVVIKILSYKKKVVSSNLSTVTAGPLNNALNHNIYELR